MTGHLEILAMLASAVICVWLFRLLKLPAILAYLFAGTLIGEHGLALAHGQVDYDHFAELGIVFLLFTLGLEFSLPKLVAMRHLVFTVGGFQVAISAIVFTLLAMLLGETANSAFVIGGILALSSTAIVIRQLSESGAIKRKSGQISVAILLFQDVAVVPLLIIIPLLAPDNNTSMLLALLWALVKGIFVVAILLLIGKWLLPRLFNIIAKVRTDELFVLTTLLVTLIASALTQWFGLSMALGAFLAGMMLGESQYKHQLEADIRPYRDILLGLFFITVGMKLDINILVAEPLTILAVLVIFMAIKIIIIKLLAEIAGEAKKDAWASAFMLAQMGEFGFVLIALANQFAILPLDTASILLVSGVISMAITPLMINNARRWGGVLAHDKQIMPDNGAGQIKREQLENHVIICGFGRVGQTVSRFLKQDNIDFIAIDIDPLRAKEARDAGEKVLFGTSRQAELLKAANIEKARLVVIAFGEDRQSIEVIQRVRSLAPHVQILVRTRNDDNLALLKGAGANEVVPESLEGSLMLVSQVLSLSGVPFSRIVRRVQKERREHYNHLHGFYQGENTDLGPNAIDRIEFAHAVLLTENADALGHTLGSLNLTKYQVSVLAVRRNGMEIEKPKDDFLVQAQDTLVLKGKPRDVEKAERFLHKGG
jgi:CPA2 family monovalent cation:H+ antiporter-2